MFGIEEQAWLGSYPSRRRTGDAFWVLHWFCYRCPRLCNIRGLQVYLSVRAWFASRGSLGYFILVEFDGGELVNYFPFLMKTPFSNVALFMPVEDFKTRCGSLYVPLLVKIIGPCAVTRSSTESRLFVSPRSTKVSTKIFSLWGKIIVCWHRFGIHYTNGSVYGDKAGFCSIFEVYLTNFG